MLSVKLSKDANKRRKLKKEKECLRIAQLNDKDVFQVSLFAEDKSKTD